MKKDEKENLKPVVWPVGQPYGQEGIPLLQKKADKKSEPSSMSSDITAHY